MDGTAGGRTTRRFFVQRMAIADRTIVPTISA